MHWQSAWLLGGAMPIFKTKGALICALTAIALLGACDHIKYHIERATPVAANPYRIELPCDIANAEIERKVAMQSLEEFKAANIATAAKIQSDCIAGNLPRNKEAWKDYIDQKKKSFDEEESKISDENRKKTFRAQWEVVEQKLNKLKEAVSAQDKLRVFVAETLPVEWIADGKIANAPPAWLRAHIEVTARSPEPTPKESPKNVAGTLSDRGQQALIEYVAKQEAKAEKQKSAGKPKPKPGAKPGAKADCDPNDKPQPQGIVQAASGSSDKAVANLLKTLREKEQDDSAADSFTTRRSIPLLISAAFNSNSPADRLEKVYIFIQPIGDSRIVDVDKVTIETVKNIAAFGKETTTQEAAPFFSLENLPFGLKATGKGGVASSKLGRQLERTLTRQFALRTISLNPDREILIIRQEGQEGTDVTGSVLSTVSLQLPNTPGVLNLFTVTDKQDDGEHASDPCKSAPPTIKRSLKTVLNLGDVEAAVTWIALTRVVYSGAGTITEEDDQVKPIVFANQFITRLWSNDLAFFTLRLKHVVDGKCHSVPLVYRDPDSQNMRLMAFKDFPSAARFRKFLATYDFSLGKPDFRLGKPAKVSIEKSDRIDVGLPIDETGKINPKVLNFDWKPEAVSAEDATKRMKERIQSLSVAVSEPKDFPIRAAFPAPLCN